MQALEKVFDFDPFIGCPFDRSEMRLVQKWENYHVGQEVQFKGLNELRTRIFPTVQGIIVAIGENARYWNGEVFTAFAVRVGSSFMHLKTHKDVWPQTAENRFDAQKLTSLFSGKQVRITYSGNFPLDDMNGICDGFHDNRFGAMDIVLSTGDHCGLLPDTVSDIAVEGDVGPMNVGRRRVVVC